MSGKIEPKSYTFSYPSRILRPSLTFEIGENLKTDVHVYVAVIKMVIHLQSEPNSRRHSNVTEFDICWFWSPMWVCVCISSCLLLNNNTRAGSPSVRVRFAVGKLASVLSPASRMSFDLHSVRFANRRKRAQLAAALHYSSFNQA